LVRAPTPFFSRRRQKGVDGRADDRLVPRHSDYDGMN
jgi:hypothetical protein